MTQNNDDIEKLGVRDKNSTGGVPHRPENGGPPRPGPKALDGGWGWVVIAGTVLAHVIYGVMVRSFGVIYLEMLSRYGGTPSATGWIGAINIAACGILGPLTSFLCVKYSHRTVTMIGGLIMAVGVLITAFSPNLALLYVSYGLIAGAGLSMTYTPGFLILGQYFDKRRGLAMGIANFGSGIGTLCFPPLLIVLFDEYGYTGALIILAGICLQCCISGALFRPLNQNKGVRKPQQVLVKQTEMKDLKHVKTVINEDLKDLEDSKNSISQDGNNQSKNLDEETAHAMEEYDALLDDNGSSVRETEEFENKRNHRVAQTEDQGNSQGNGVCNIKDVGENSNGHDETNESSCNVVNEKDEPSEQKPLNGHDTNLLSDNAVKADNRNNTKDKKSILCCFKNKPKIESSNKPKKPPLFDIELIKDVRFVATCVVIFSAAQALALTSGFLPALAVEHGASPTSAAFLLSVSGMSSSVGGLVLGGMMDLKSVKPYRINLFSIYSFMVGLNTILNPLAREYWEFVILSILRAGFAGVMVAQRATIVADLVGPRKVPNAFGWLLFFFSLGSLFGRAIGGTLKDALGSYGAPFYVSGGMSLFCCAVFTILTIPPTACCWLFNRKPAGGNPVNYEAK